MRKGTTLIELLLFLAFFSLTAGVLLSFFFSTAEQRVRQQAITTVEQTGVHILQTLTNRIRSAERILSPATGESGAVLALQLADASLHPTVVGLETGALIVGEYNQLKKLSNSGVTVSQLTVHNTSARSDRQSVWISFSISRTIPLTIPLNYVRVFEAVISLYPDDQPAIHCGGACNVPTCADGAYVWEICEQDSCKNSGVSFSCT